MFFYILKTPFGDNNDKEVVDFLFVPHSFIWSVVSSSTAICPPCLPSTFIPSRFCVSGLLDWWKSILLVVYIEISEVFLAFFKQFWYFLCKKNGRTSATTITVNSPPRTGSGILDSYIYNVINTHIKQQCCLPISREMSKMHQLIANVISSVKCIQQSVWINVSVWMGWRKP